MHNSIKYKPKRVVYNDIQFDSSLELKVYKLLLEASDYLVIDTHIPISINNVSWKIDFVLTSKNKIGRTIINRLYFLNNSFVMKDHCFLEVKGILDKNFINKVKKIGKEKIKDVILVSSLPSAISLENKDELDIYLQPILSLSMLSCVLRSSY